MKHLSHPVRDSLRALAVVTLAAAVPLAAGPAHAAGRAAAAQTNDWPMFGHDPARSGAVDGSITTANVGMLKRRWVTTFSDTADSTPILLAHVTETRGGTRALLFETTRGGVTYALDAHSGAVVWRYTSPPPKVYSFSANSREQLITTSTPVADPSGRYIYAPAIDGQVHKLTAATGAEVRGMGFPLRITRMPDVEKDASALNLANGYLYATTSGYVGDRGPYNGHVVALRLRDGATHVFNTLCSNIRALPLDKQYDARSTSSCPNTKSGMWSRAGVVVDPDPSMGGRIYAASGNGLFDANKGGTNYGDSILSLSADGSRRLGYFTPTNYSYLEQDDLDLGSTAPVMLPREPRSRTPLMAVQGGKDQAIHLVDRARLGGVGAGLQTLHIDGAVLFTQPAMWRQPGGGTWVYVGDNSELRALRLVTNGQGVSRLVTAWTEGVGSTSPVVSNGVVFAATSGVLNAFDARTDRRLWTSSLSSAGGGIGGIHWESPIVVNGYVYISDESGHLTAYALPGR